jgi:hypothetical protein
MSSVVLAVVDPCCISLRAIARDCNGTGVIEFAGIFSTVAAVVVASLFAPAPGSDLFNRDAFQGFEHSLNVTHTVLGFVSSQHPDVVCVYVSTDNAPNFSGIGYAPQ